MQNTVAIYKRFSGPTALFCSGVGLVVLVIHFRQGLDISFLYIGLVLGLFSWKSKCGKAAVIIPVCVALLIAIMIVVSDIIVSQ
jgi:hypothetical protein